MRRLRATADRKTAEIIPAIFDELFGDPEANPRGWSKKPLGKLLTEGPQNGLYKPYTEYGSGTPIIRITDFYDGRLTTRQIQRVRVSESEAASYGLNDGNILVNRVNSMEYLGKSAVVEHLTEPTVFESNMMRLSLKREEVEPQFLIELLQNPGTMGRLRRRAKHAVNQASVNQGDVLSLSVIVPPPELQQRFARIVAECRSVAVVGKPDSDVEQSPEQELLDSLLSHAFTGELTAD